ncbi:hypothetical protein WR25_20838 [Diploscapter pachys]|uniref:MAM domain-containing protein n=1 Tax=Diploscapter pachys TaxID=2018661 RepID=A0A2A2JPJ5_9BILA|nr:hypothetical protein WR25_20838 [Diploscapter pachys]
MAMIRDIKYHATICTEPPLQFAFNSLELPTETEAFAITSILQVNCEEPKDGCLWANGDDATAMWRVGRNTERFHSLLDLPETFVKPNTSFYFLAIDTLSPRPYAQLKSPLLPCTRRPTVLSLKYWINAGTQLEVCSRDSNGVSLSCAYLAEENSPGPIEIEVDAYEQPMRFTLEVIAFDETTHGIAVVSDISVKGLLCSEPRPLATTTINPDTIHSMFSIQAGPGKLVPYSESLDCEFSRDFCSQWINDDGSVGYGVVPEDSDNFPIPNELKGIFGK